MTNGHFNSYRQLAHQQELAITQQAQGNKQYEKVTDPVYMTDAGFITLTFDDGPTVHTEQLLEDLAKKNARAIFFMIGENVKKYPEMARKVLEAGHIIGNHSYTHPFFAKISLKEQEEELDRTIKEIQDATGYTPPYFRPPYGSFNESTLLAAMRRNMKTVMWSADPKDYSYNTSSAVYRAAEPLLASRKILLLHDLKNATADALPSIIDDILKKDLRVTVQYQH